MGLTRAVQQQPTQRPAPVRVPPLTLREREVMTPTQASRFSQQEKERFNYKRELCAPFSKYGSCSRGEYCTWAHGPAELRGPGKAENVERAEYNTRPNDRQGLGFAPGEDLSDLEYAASLGLDVSSLLTKR